MTKLAISTIQTNLFWEDKTANLNMLAKKIETVEQAGVVVLPEMFSTGFSMQPKLLAEPMDGPTMDWMRNLAMRRKIILTGSFMAAEEGNFFNRLVWMLPDGHFGYYDKRHLFAYAGEDKHYTAGKRRLVARVNGWKILLLVCYDLRFPVWSRQRTNETIPEYDAIIYVANWPDRRNLAWRTLLQARAIENQCYVIGVNRVGNDGNGIYHSGYSSVIDPLGEILYQQKDSEDISTHLLEYERLQETREKLPFWKDGDSFQVL